MAKTEKSRVRAGELSPPDRARSATPALAAETPVGLWVLLGAVTLFLAACAFGMLEVHGSTDTWISLAGGRVVMEGLRAGKFPVADPFNYGEPGVEWFNQNWLSHVYFWLLYDYFGRSAVIIGCWALSVATFTFVLLATWFRCRSWIPAIVAGALAGIGGRDWLSARPATVQFFCIALLWLCLSALIGQGTKRRWWPIGVLAILFLAWPHAHGSFIFGFGMVGLFTGGALVAWLLKQHTALSRNQWIALLGVTLVTAILGAVLSPYGLDNYTHQSKIAASSDIRMVGEWRPPIYWRENAFPPVRRFWGMMGLVVVALAVSTIPRLVRFFSAEPLNPRLRSVSPSAAPPRPPAWLHLLLFDIAAALLGLCMALWARRFAPLFYILATPALTVATLSVRQFIGRELRSWVHDVLGVAVWAGAAATIYYTGFFINQDLIRPFRTPGKQECDLLCRVTRHDNAPREVIEFLKRNALKPHIFTDWKLYGPIMFEVPDAKVFIDGRAQQVYSEEHYNRYNWLMGYPEQDRSKVSPNIASAGTDAIVLAQWGSMEHLARAVLADPLWLPALKARDGILLVRRGSALGDELLARDRAGQLWWPENWPAAQSSRGNMYAAAIPPDYPRALELWQAGIAQDALLGLDAYRAIAQAYANLGRVPDALAYFQSQREKLSHAAPDSAEARQLLSLIDACEQALRRPTPPPG